MDATRSKACVFCGGKDENDTKHFRSFQMLDECTKTLIKALKKDDLPTSRA
jgi:hypothetical protein